MFIACDAKLPQMLPGCKPLHIDDDVCCTYNSVYGVMRCRVSKTMLRWLKKLQALWRNQQYIICDNCRYIHTEQEVEGGAVYRNMVQKGRKRQHCLAPLSKSLSLPYRQIVPWLEDMMYRLAAEEKPGKGSSGWGCVGKSLGVYDPKEKTTPKIWQPNLD